MDSHWVVLRCGSSKTIECAEILASKGLEVWVPIQKIKRRLPRSRKVETLEVPALPSYIFVKREFLAELQNLLNLFVVQGRLVVRSDLRIAEVSFSELMVLQRAVDAFTLEEKDLEFLIGDRYKFLEGPLEGVTGEVIQASKGKVVLSLGEGAFTPFVFSGLQLSKISVLERTENVLRSNTKRS
jgi:transcription antitermination factor NusG